MNTIYIYDSVYANTYISMLSLSSNLILIILKYVFLINIYAHLIILHNTWGCFWAIAH